MMKDKRACISMLARDCYASLKINIPKFTDLLSQFADNSIIQVVENDSVDGTKELLQSWNKAVPAVHIISEDTNQLTYDPTQQAGAYSRIQKMANFRNKYLKILSNEQFDYLIVIDADLVDFNINSIILAIENAPADWCGLFANGRYYFNFLGKTKLLKYYDLFAYIPNQKQFKRLSIPFSYELTYKEMALFSDYLNYKKNDLPNYIDCYSAFGGIGIYNLIKYKGQNYSTKKNQRSTYFDTICEHISFNTQYGSEGKNYICKNMIALYEKQGFKKLLSYPFHASLKFFILEKILHKKVFE